MAQILFDPALIRPEVIERVFNYRRDPGVRVMLQQVGAQLLFTNGKRVDFRGQLKSVKAPTLVVWGREDRLVPVRQAENAHAIPDVMMNLFDRCGHLPQAEHPEAFNTLAMEFLQKP